jgi:hypothetical protein
MKKFGLILMLIAIVLSLSGQEITKENIGEKQLTAKPDTNENTKVVIGNDLLSVEDSKEAFKVRVGDRGLSILETLEGPKITFEKPTDIRVSNQPDNEEQKDTHPRTRPNFRGHWSGIEFGFNNFLMADKSMVIPEEINYMSLHSGKSNNFNINFYQHSFGLSKHIGFVTGLGINWNNYRFDKNNNIIKNSVGDIVELDTTAILEKSKLTTAYLTLPVMLEVQIPADNHHIDFAAGFIGAIKLGSHSKMVFQDGDKVKSNGDFSLNMLRYGVSARIGYQNWQIYGTYYTTPLFIKGKGPGGYDLFPFEIGFAFSFND